MFIYVSRPRQDLIAAVLSLLSKTKYSEIIILNHRNRTTKHEMENRRLNKGNWGLKYTEVNEETTAKWTTGEPN